MPWFMTPFGPQYVIEPGTVDEFERRDYVSLTAQQAADYFAGVAFPDPPSFVTEAELADFAVEQRAALGTSNAIFNVEQYGAVADAATDCTEAIQDAIDAANAAGGGVIWFPSSGVYLVAGPQRTGVGAQSYAYSGQILLPARPMNGSRAVIAFRGPLPAPQVTWQVGPEPAHTSGAVLKSTATSGNVIDCVSATASLSPISNVFFVLDSLTVRCPNDPQCGAVNAQAAAGLLMRNVVVDVDSPGSGVQFPTGTRPGIYAPEAGNAAFVRIVDTQVMGYPVGIVHSEHAQLNNVTVQMCAVALRPRNGALHGATYDRVLIQECPIGIQSRSGVSGDAGTIRGFIDVESFTSDPWKQQYVIDDPDSKLYGSLSVLQTTNLPTGYPARGCRNLALSSPLQGDAPWMLSFPLDTFHRVVDNATEIGVTDQSSHIWTCYSPFTTTGGRAKSNTGPWAGVAIVGWVARSGGANSHAVTARLTTAAGAYQIGVVLNRVYSNGNFLFVTLTGGQVKIGKSVGGEDGVLASSSAGIVAAGTSYTLVAALERHLLDAPTVTAYLNGTQVATYTLTSDETAVLTEQDPIELGRADGLRTYDDNNSYCDLFKVTPGAY